MAVARRRKKESYWHTCIIEPFDIAMFHTRDGGGLLALQNRFATWLRGLAFPARFVYWQMPADLRQRIDYVADLSRQEQDPLKKQMLMESRRNYEQLQNGANYHRSLCGIGVWTDDSLTSEAVARSVAGSFDTPAYVSPWPRLFEGNYRLSDGQGQISPLASATCRQTGRAHVLRLSQQLRIPARRLELLSSALPNPCRCRTRWHCVSISPAPTSAVKPSRR